MKKFARIMSLALVAVMLCATLASCGAPAKDPADAVAALKEEGYVAVKLLSVVTGVKDGEAVIITYYDDADKAKEAMDKMDEAAIEELKGKLVALGLSEEGDLVGPKRSGKMIYMGTKAAIKAAK